MKKFNLVKNQGYFQSLRDTKSVKTTKDENGVEAVEIEGYASTKDKDRVGDIVVPEAFKSALEGYMMNPIVLLQHKADKPIGVVEEANIDDNGLYIKAKITENTDGVMNQIKNGVLRAFSIGYRVKDYDTDARELADGSFDFTNIIKDLELFEISVVSIPANPFALSKSIESLLEVKDVEEAVEDEVQEEAEEKSEEVEQEESEAVEEKEEVDEELSDEEEKEAEEVFEGSEEKDGDDVVESKEDEAVEQTEIEETEVEEVSENDSESESNDEVVDETSNDEVVETKSIEVSSQKALDEINNKIESMQKGFDKVLAEKEAQIKSLQNKVEIMSKLFAESVSTIEKLSTEIKNIPVASGLSYKRPLKKGGYSDIAETLKSLS